MSLKEVRRIKGYTQKALSEEAGVNLQMLRKYEQGTKDINKARIQTILKLSIVLNCNIEDILTDESTLEYLTEYRNTRCREWNRSQNNMSLT